MNPEELKQYEDYFKDDMERIETEISKSDDLYNLIKGNIDRIERTDSKGSYRYLIEHFKNIIALQTQKQGILRDRVNLKKVIMDYANKVSDETGDKAELMAELNRLIQEQVKKGKVNAANNPVNYPTMDEKDLDSEIDNILEENNEDD